MVDWRFLAEGRIANLEGKNISTPRFCRDIKFPISAINRKGRIPGASTLFRLNPLAFRAWGM
jgi:hypothetical protein